MRQDSEAVIKKLKDIVPVDSEKEIPSAISAAFKEHQNRLAELDHARQLASVRGMSRLLRQANSVDKGPTGSLICLGGSPH